MKKITRIRNILLVSLAVIFVAASCIGEAWAYFTTYASARGGHIIKLGYETEITEEVSGKEKRVKITNKEGSQPVFIRARAFSAYDLDYEGDDWTDSSTGCDYRNVETGDGEWYYYKYIVEGGKPTTELKISITFPKGSKDGDSFNVVVVYESTLVRYDDEGHPYADWSRKLVTD